MARRRSRSRRRNPSALQWGLIGLGAVAVGGLSFWGYKKWKEKEALPSPDPDRPIPPIPPIDEDDLGMSPCGADYPGFVVTDEGCEPSAKTPAGIYVTDDCGDFVFVEGESGTQLAWLTAAIDRAVSRTRAPKMRSADPTSIATRFFRRFWSGCTWPSAAASPRATQLFNAITYVIGREIIAGGGRVLGTSDPDIVDEQIAERLAELGLPEFDPSIVPEIRLPDALPDPAVPPSKGPAIPAQITPIGP